MATEKERVHQQQLAKLVEFGLAKNFVYVASYRTPEAFRGGACGAFSRLDMDSNPRYNDRLRQEYLAKDHKTDEQIEESIFAALQTCPCLAKKQYTTFAGQAVFPRKLGNSG